MRTGFLCCSILVCANLVMADVPPQRRRTVRPSATEPHWISPTHLWVRSTTAEETRFLFIDAEKKTIEPAIDTKVVAVLLARELKRPIDPNRLHIDNLKFNHDFDMIEITGYGAKWKYDVKARRITKLDGDGKEKSVNGTLPVSRTPRPSRRTGGDTAIVFENRLKEDVVIFWNDADGKKQKYGDLSPGKLREQHTYAGDVWVITKKNGELVGVFAGEERPGRAVIDGRPADKPKQSAQRKSGRQRTTPQKKKWDAFCRDHNLWIRNRDTNQERPLTHDGNEKLTWHRSVLRDRGVHLRYNRKEAAADQCEAYWSPDGEYLIAIRTHVVPLPFVNIVQAAGPNGQPKLISYPYFKPGDKLPLQEPRLFHAKTGREIVISNALFPNPFELSQIRWRPDSSGFTFLYNQRGHQVLRHLYVEADSGNVTAVCDEQSDTFVDYAGKFYVRELAASNETVWMSERDGWNHLYLFDSTTGELKNQITKGEWVVRGVERIDEKRRQIYFKAGGIHSEQDPYYVHYCRIDFDGTNLVKLTDEDGTHEVTVGPGNRYLFDKYSRVDMPARFEVRSAKDGKLAVKLPFENYKPNRPMPERFVAAGRDGQTKIYGIIHRPRDFDPNKRYPVVEYIYAGPHSAFVPKSFRTSYRHQHQIADLGCIVVQIDGMGTSQRSKAFHDVCWKNIADAGFPDRIAWMKSAAQKFPFMDLSNVGVYGGSAGGQNALAALLHHGDFYKVAVADCGCHDNRMDKIWWNELWMSWPIGKHYDQQSNVSNAFKLKGKLLLVVGEVDKNVDPASTMQVVNALVKANKDFEFLMVPGGGHGIAESSYGSKRRADFFRRNLIGSP